MDNKNITVNKIVEICNGKLLSGDENIQVKTYSKDTRTLNKGDMYLGIKGEKINGNDYIEQAFINGAIGCITDENVSEKIINKYKKEKVIIKVENTIKAIQELAKYKRSLYDIPVIAVTGSVGKTSTKDIIANVLGQKYKVLKTEGNMNNHIGLPMTLLKLKDHTAVVVEMGMNHFGEISVLTSIAKPTICVITNIGTSHIGNLGSRENILKAKLEILEGCKNPKVIINNDNDLLHKWYVENKEKYDIKTYGINEKSLFNAENIELQEQSSSFDCNIDGETKNITINVGGEHFILNALCAITVGKEMGISSDKIVKGIESFELTQKRMDMKKLDNGALIINDAYNASFESMKASLKVLAEYKEHRKIAVLGDMFELGDFAKGLHENVGKEVAKNKIDILIASGENSKYIVEKAKEGLKSENIYYFEDKEKIEELLLKIVKPNDVILFKASNGMQFYKLAERMVEIWKK